MDKLRKSLWQLGIYGAVLAYIAGDLFLFHGPIARKVESRNPFNAESIEAAKARGIVAQVFNHPITRGQVERAVRERLWRTGQDYESLSANNQLVARYAALDELIDHELLRVKAMAHAEKLILDKADLDARVERFQRRFPSEDSMRKAMKSQGITDDQDLRDRIAAQMQQEAYVELKVGPLTQVTEDEAREWHAKNKAALAHPEQRHIRHIFLPSLSVKEEDARRQLQAALGSIGSGAATFEQLARSTSQDPASKGNGGDLGWVSRDRLPQDFAEKVFGLPTRQPTLVESRIGWHLVEILDQRPARERSFEEARAEVVAALEAVKRREAVRDYRKALRQFEGHRVLIHHEVMR